MSGMTVPGRRSGKWRPLQTGGLGLLAIAIALALAACDSSPRGAGSALVTVEWEGAASPLGAAKVFLLGEGLGAATGEEGAMAWSHTPAGEEGGIRVVVIHTGTPSTLRFTIPLDDLERGAPQATLWRLIDQENNLVSLGVEGYRVRVSLVR